MKYGSLRSGGLVIAAFAVVGLAMLAQSEEVRKLVTRSWDLCDYKTDLDGQWEGSIVASDGNCYFASSTHSGRTGAMFFKFDPRTEKIGVLTGDITKVCGDDPTRDAPQGKVHSTVDEMDGWLYFGTHESYSTPARPYRGAHLIGYEMKTGRLRDFGVLEPRYTNYAGLAADPKSKCVYVYLIYPGQRNNRPSFIYRVDVRTGQKRKVHEFPGMLGSMQAGGYDAAVYYMYCDPSGVLWLPTWKGRLARYDPAKDVVDLIDGVLPVKAEMPYQNWMWIRPISGQGRAAVTCGDGLYVFNPSGGKPSFKFVARIGKTDLGTAIAGSVVYYIQDLHLKAVNIGKENPDVTDYGLVTDQDGRRPWRLPSLAADTQGGIYITGDWFTQGNDTATTRLTRDNKTGEETYPAQNRCERFAYVKVTPPGK